MITQFLTEPERKSVIVEDIDYGIDEVIEYRSTKCNIWSIFLYTQMKTIQFYV